jgi:hypothetical protein
MSPPSNPSSPSMKGASTGTGRANAGQGVQEGSLEGEGVRTDDLDHAIGERDQHRCGRGRGGGRVA